MNAREDSRLVDPEIPPKEGSRVRFPKGTKASVIMRRVLQKHNELVASYFSECAEEQPFCGSLKVPPLRPCSATRPRGLGNCWGRTPRAKSAPCRLGQRDNWLAEPRLVDGRRLRDTRGACVGLAREGNIRKPAHSETQPRHKQNLGIATRAPLTTSSRKATLTTLDRR